MIAYLLYNIEIIILIYSFNIELYYIEHIGQLARMSVLDTEVDGLNPGNSLFP